MIYTGDYTTNDVITWIERDLIRIGRENYTQIHKQTANNLHLSLFTDRYEYKLYASREGQHSYLGMIVSARKPRAGEEHTRGNDLADGPLTPETWHHILADIVRHELVPLDIQVAGVPFDYTHVAGL